MTDGSKRVADENQNQLTGEKRIVDEAFGMVDEHLLEALRKRSKLHRLTSFSGSAVRKPNVCTWSCLAFAC